MNTKLSIVIMLTFFLVWQGVKVTLINVWRLLLKGMSHIKIAKIKQTLRLLTGLFVLKQVTVDKATGKSLEPC